MSKRILVASLMAAAVTTTVPALAQTWGGSNQRPLIAAVRAWKRSRALVRTHSVAHASAAARWQAQ